jgi:hypothetical protein
MLHPAVCFHSSCFGSEEHLLVNYETKQVSWVNVNNPSDVPNALWVGLDELSAPGACVEEFLRLHGITEMPSFAPKRLIRELEAVSSSILSTHTIPWRLCLSNLEFQTALKNFMKATNIKLFPLWETSLQTNYYKTTYAKTTETLLHFQPAKINVDFYEKINKEDAENVTIVFTSFKPNEKGFASGPPVYSKSHSKTGRLKITEGPKILLLDKKYREKIFESRFGDDGVIVQLDYKSLEPRVILAHMKKFYQASLPDIYSGITTNKSIPRDLIKNITLTKLYGGGKEKIHNLFGEIPFDDKVIHSIEEYFSFNEITQLINDQVAKTGFLQNAYGRLIDITSVEAWVRLNYFAQSTAVDVALLGFGNMIRYIVDHGLQDNIVPLFILHDALILDIHKKHMSKLPWLKIAGSTNIAPYESVTFYLEDTVITP